VLSGKGRSIQNIPLIVRQFSKNPCAALNQRCCQLKQLLGAWLLMNLCRYTRTGVRVHGGRARGMCRARRHEVKFRREQRKDKG
jgi:hypothetical protein